MSPLVSLFALLVIVAILLAARWLKNAHRVASVQSHDASLEHTPIDPDVMVGGLQHMALADLLQFLAQGGHSGSLHIFSGRRSGIIRMVQGLVVHAEFRRKQDLKAMAELLKLEIGDFRFHFETPGDEPVRGREVVDILMLCLAGKEDLK